MFLGPAAIRAASKMAEQVRVEKPSAPAAVSTSKPVTSQVAAAASTSSRAKTTVTKEDNRTVVSTSKPVTSQVSAAASTSSRAKMTVTKEDNRTLTSPPPLKKTKRLFRSIFCSRLLGRREQNPGETADKSSLCGNSH